MRAIQSTAHTGAENLHALDRGDLTVVDRLADFTAEGKRRRIYSFATKFCSWHSPETFPIYDCMVLAALLEIQRDDTFASFGAGDLQQYRRFVEVLGDFRRYHGLEEFNFREIDKYLWRFGTTKSYKQGWQVGDDASPTCFPTSRRHCRC